MTRQDTLRSITRADRVVEAEIRHRLGILGGARRWEVAVPGGQVSIVDRPGDPTERHVADVLVQAVAGVTDLRFVGELAHVDG